MTVLVIFVLWLIWAAFLLGRASGRRQMVKAARQFHEHEPKHEHSWHAPANFSPDDLLVWKPTKADIEFQLCGNVCACGARRIYRGPSRGWEEIERG